MRIDLTHNRIVRETMTDRFQSEVRERLIPMLRARYGERLEAVQMYDDYFDVDLRYAEEFYYPMTVVIDGSPSTAWVRWNMSDAAQFENNIPYAYIGDGPLNFAFAEDDAILTRMKVRVDGRAIFCEEGLLPMEIVYPDGDPLFLSGKVSQTFLDAIDRSMTAEIAAACGVEGLADSGITLKLVFAAETFMEHTSENVTYRRLHLSAKGCAPRDFWVKWTRVDASGAFSLADAPASDEIKLELGEDVPQKIREKEYRYLAFSDAAKYAASTAKKNVTEWRDLIRRAVKRGELTRKEAPVVEERDPSDLNDALNELLRGYRPAAEAAKLPDAPTQSAENFAQAELAAILAANAGEKQEDEGAIGAFTPEKVGTETAQKEPFSSPATEEAQVGIDEEQTEKETPKSPPDEERLRAEIEAKVRLEYENQLRRKAEKEAEELRREREALRRENERLQEEARREMQRRAEEENRLRAEIEEREKADARERERLKEAARSAIAERERLEAERAEEEARKEAARRAAQEQREKEERLLREEQERAREEERLRAEREAQRLRAEEERARAEHEARLRSGFGVPAGGQEPAQTVRAADPAKKAHAPDAHYTYASYVAHIYFRHPVDPNITARIREIIGLTLQYFHKEDIFMRVKATVPDQTTVVLDFVKFPEQENELLINIIKVLGNSDLGVAKITLD